MSYSWSSRVSASAYQKAVGSLSRLVSRVSEGVRTLTAPLRSIIWYEGARALVSLVEALIRLHQKVWSSGLESHIGCATALELLHLLEMPMGRRV